MVKAAIVIPTRLNSKRLPNKPLLDIGGMSLIEHCWRTAKQANFPVIISSPDQALVDHCKAFGARAVRTSMDCINGTERCLRTVPHLPKGTDVIVNVQGDMFTFDPACIDKIIIRSQCGVATPITLCSYEEWEYTNTPKVVIDAHGYALYFSRAGIPALSSSSSVSVGLDSFPVYKHIGIYAYTISALQRYHDLAPSALERAECLEQLRFIENRISIRTVMLRADTSLAVNTQADLVKARSLWAEQKKQKTAELSA